MKEKTIVLLAIALALFTMLMFACTGVTASRTPAPDREPVGAVSAETADEAGLALVARRAYCDPA